MISCIEIVSYTAERDGGFWDWVKFMGRGVGWLGNNRWIEDGCINKNINMLGEY